MTRRTALAMVAAPFLPIKSEGANKCVPTINAEMMRFPIGLAGWWQNGSTGMSALVDKDGAVLEMLTREEANERYVNAIKSLYVERTSEVALNPVWTEVKP